LLNFSEHLLLENIGIADGKLVFHDTGDGAQSTKFGKRKFLPYVSKAKKFDGIPIYSAYKLSPHIGNKVLKSLKRKSDVEFKEHDYDFFIKKTAIYLASNTFGALNDVDVIVTPQTSSFIINDILEQIHEIKPNIKIIKETFKKVDISKLKVDYDTMPPSMAKRMKAILETSKKVGYLEIKKVPKQFLSFIHNFLKLDSSNIKPKYVDGQNVVVFDDLLGSGFTMKEMVNSIKTLSPNRVVGMTMFKT